ncbi:hypothetical protein KUTeg_013301 [Tegillarca granosa]|uniref:Uncharacterized protein n=1 Tax=Tegillarca granosa TaxID=220873 RepID=A0ABQ9EXS5_TEGGR|nr:hypothetical protein KUTeg_013301 [Tegillarca granosa]
MEVTSKNPNETEKPKQAPPRLSLIKQSSLAHRPIQEETVIVKTADPTSSIRPNSNSSGNIVNKTDVNCSNSQRNNNDSVKQNSRPNSTNKKSNDAKNGSTLVSNLPERSMPDGSSRNNTTISEKDSETSASQAAAQAIGTAVSSFTLQDNAFTVDMNDLEQELVKLAPQIALLFQKISRANPGVKATKNELKELKGENDKLRKANRSLVEKLNIFQQKIIQLQLENKRLRDTGLNSKDSLVDLINRAEELSALEKKLCEQKRELDAKEKELNEHLRKIEEIEKENEQQKQQIKKLQILHEENLKERTKQREQITELREDKERHQKQIELMEELQRKEEERFLRLEHRLRLLEQASMPRYRPNDHDKRRSSRVMSPPKAMPWMSGVVNRSHHANVKFTPPAQRDGKEALAPTEKGWAL